MTDTNPPMKSTAKKELALLVGLLFFGLLLLPVAIYIVGGFVFGEYGGAGFSEFYGRIHSALRGGDPVVLFLVFSPYLVWQLTRLVASLFRHSWRRRQNTSGETA